MHEKCRFLGLFRPFRATIHSLQKARRVPTSERRPAMDDKTRLAAGIATELQGLKYDDKRLAEIAAEVAVLNEAVRQAAAARLTFDDEPAAFASVLERQAQK